MLLPLTVCSVCLIIPTPIATILCGSFWSHCWDFHVRLSWSHCWECHSRLWGAELLWFHCQSFCHLRSLCVNLSDSGSDHSASARNVSDSTAGRSASRDYSMPNLSESVCLLCPGPGPARSASQDLSCSICPKGLQCSASQDLFASICPKGLQRSASQDLFASICPKDPQCSASQDLFASICPKDPHAPHSPDENRSECLWNLPDSKVDQSTIENPWACLQRLPYHIAYLSQILHATRTPLGYVLLLEVPHWLSSAKSSEKTIKTEPDLILGRNCHLLLQSIDSIEELSYLQNANISSNAVKFEATISLIPCFLPPVHKRSHISLPIHKSSS